eukprot:scaffold3960_cov116-Isochrysis_galbana.AAC.14
MAWFPDGIDKPRTEMKVLCRCPLSGCTGSAQGAAQVQGALTLWTLQSAAQPRPARTASTASCRPLVRGAG